MPWQRWTAAMLVFACFSDAGAEFKVADLQPRFVEQALVLSGDLELGLNAKVEEALSKGIPLEVAIDIHLYRVRRFLWDPNIAAWTLHRRIQYHALSGQYLVSTLLPEAEAGESLLTLPEALKQLGALNEVKLPLEQPVTEHEHSVDVRVSLDIEALPTPLRPVAYTSFTWHLNSGWSSWKVTP
ncbi:MAG: DUF4390 domain-containing protein [Gammaproteobacteria bacterium]|nr:DUF4390 domain-containing protein [Gammaproteobacteria bacterium]